MKGFIWFYLIISVLAAGLFVGFGHPLFLTATVLALGMALFAGLVDYDMYHRVQIRTYKVQPCT